MHPHQPDRAFCKVKVTENHKDSTLPINSRPFRNPPSLNYKPSKSHFMDSKKPLAERMRPMTLSDYIGQAHLVGPNGVISKMIDNKTVGSMIFWGPPGVGKTTLARLIAKESGLQFFSISAIQAGVKDVRNLIDAGRKLGKALLFIDEIHRFNKAQQDALLGAVEDGTLVLIGATTENPSFEVISALLSRCQVYILNHHGTDELDEILVQALDHDPILKKAALEVKEKEALFRFSGGDARKLLNILELLANQKNDRKVIDNVSVEEILQQTIALYDKDGEQHYDIISAFIKSIRGSDPNGAVYWLARMLDGGEDIKFIARRLVISAAEDIGLANPTALVLANSCFQSVNIIGMPEARIVLSETTIYLATSPKSNSSYLAIDAALAQVKREGNLGVPLHLRNAPTKLMKNLNYGAGYQYSHDHPESFVQQDFLPEKLKGFSFYNPLSNTRETSIRKQLADQWKGWYKY